jgi:hypothetical protein
MPAIKSGRLLSWRGPCDGRGKAGDGGECGVGGVFDMQIPVEIMIETGGHSRQNNALHKAKGAPSKRGAQQKRCPAKRGQKPDPFNVQQTNAANICGNACKQTLPGQFRPDRKI